MIDKAYVYVSEISGEIQA